MSAQFLVVFQLTGFAFRRWFFPPISSSILLCCLFPSSALLLNLKKQTHQKQNGKYMAVSQNCVWNVLRRSGRTERRGFVTGLVPAIHKLYVYIYIYVYCKYVYNIHLKDMHVEATHAGCRSFSLLICTASLLYTCSTQVCLAWVVLVH